MREIQVDLDIFAKIWSLRMMGEHTENDVLRRILLGASVSIQSALAGMPENKTTSTGLELNISNSNEGKKVIMMGEVMGKIRWVDDVQMALGSLGGSASLHEIYKVVIARRREAGRTVPPTVEAIIRRTLEDHSSDSANFKSDDIFRLLGRGEWGLR